MIREEGNVYEEISNIIETKNRKYYSLLKGFINKKREKQK